MCCCRHKNCSGSDCTNSQLLVYHVQVNRFKTLPSVAAELQPQTPRSRISIALRDQELSGLGLDSNPANVRWMSGQKVSSEQFESFPRKVVNLFLFKTRLFTLVAK